MTIKRKKSLNKNNMNKKQEYFRHQWKNLWMKWPLGNCIFKTQNWWWSLEKRDEGIFLQNSKEKKLVVETLLKNKRTKK